MGRGSQAVLSLENSDAGTYHGFAPSRSAHLPPSSLHRPAPLNLPLPLPPCSPPLPLQAYPFLSHSLHHLSPFTVAQLAWALGHLRWEGEVGQPLMRAGFLGLQGRGGHDFHLRGATAPAMLALKPPC